jgi:HEPN domain-containing protein
MTAQAAAEMADRHFEAKAADLRRWIDTAEYQTGRAAADEGFRKLAAFSLHQAVETAYACFLLVHTFYFPRSHNIKFLRSLAEDVNTGLVEAWPREHRFDRRRFELLKRAYVEARYSDQYDASAEDLDWLMTRARHLRDLVADLCQARINELKTKAETA